MQFNTHTALVQYFLTAKELTLVFVIKLIRKKNLSVILTSVILIQNIQEKIKVHWSPSQEVNNNASFLLKNGKYGKLISNKI